MLLLIWNSQKVRGNQFSSSDDIYIWGFFVAVVVVVENSLRTSLGSSHTITAPLEK